MTAEADAGRAVAQLAVLALDPATSAQVPDNARMRVAPVTLSHAAIAAAAARVQGVPEARVVGEDLTAFKGALKERPSENFFDYLR